RLRARNRRPTRVRTRVRRAEGRTLVSEAVSEAPMALPAEILDAIIAVLDAEALRTDFDSRVRLLQATSATIEDGRAGASRPSKLSSSSAQPLRPQGRSQGRG